MKNDMVHDDILFLWRRITVVKLSNDLTQLHTNFNPYTIKYVNGYLALINSLAS